MALEVVPQVQQVVLVVEVELEVEEEELLQKLLKILFLQTKLVKEMQNGNFGKMVVSGQTMMMLLQILLKNNINNTDKTPIHLI